MTDITQYDIAHVFSVSQPFISQLLKGRPVTWPFAAKLAEKFPEKGILSWKNATPAELKIAFKQLELEVSE